MTSDHKRGQSDDTSRGSIVRNGSEGDEVLRPPGGGRGRDADEADEADQSGTRGPRGKATTTPTRGSDGGTGR